MMSIATNFSGPFGGSNFRLRRRLPAAFCSRSCNSPPQFNKCHLLWVAKNIPFPHRCTYAVYLSVLRPFATSSDIKYVVVKTFEGCCALSRVWAQH